MKGKGGSGRRSGKKADIATIVRKLSGHYGLTEKTWNKNPFTVLIGTIISQRTRDEQTAIAAEALLSKFRNVDQLSKAPVREIERLIKPAGFYRVKARQIKKVAKELIDRFGGKVPDDMDELLSLPSVGRKTANCVLVYGFKKDAIPVDTHVHRISNRLGWVRTKTPEETEERLVVLLPKRYWLAINDLFVTHGKTICRPIGPKCPICPVNNICPKRISVRGRGGRRT